MGKKKNAQAFSKERKKKNAKSVLSDVAGKLKGKELFPEKVERAKKYISHLRAFPS